MGRKHKPHEDDDDDGPLAPEAEPDAGKAVGAYCGWAKKPRFGRLTLEVFFEIVAPHPDAGQRVTLYCNFGDDGKAGLASKYYELWCKANNGPPKTRRLSPKVFQGYWLLELVKTKQKTTRTGVRPLRPDELGRT